MYLPTTDDLSALCASHWRKRDASSQAIAKMMDKNEDILSVAFYGDFSAQILQKTLNSPSLNNLSAWPLMWSQIEC